MNKRKELNQGEGSTKRVDVVAVELRRIPRGGTFKLPGDNESVYTRGPYSREGRDFQVLHAASMTHSYMLADALVYPFRAALAARDGAQP